MSEHPATAERMKRISPSLTVAMRQRARALRAEGKDVLAVSSGEPDFETPRHIKDAAIAAIERGETRYTDIAGTRALRRAVAEKFARDNGLDYAPDADSDRTPGSAGQRRYPAAPGSSRGGAAASTAPRAGCR